MDPFCSLLFFASREREKGGRFFFDIVRLFVRSDDPPRLSIEDKRNGFNLGKRVAAGTI